MTDPAPLVSTAEAPTPAGGWAEWVTGAGGARLRAALFPALLSPAGGEARGSVVVSPGRTEPIEKYFEVVGDLRARGFAVLVHDWRGQGLSQRLLPDRLKGHASGLSDFLEDYRLLLSAFADRLPEPWIALGHSMGGCLVLLDLERGETRFKGCLLSAPMLGLSTAGLPGPMARLVAWGMVSSGQGPSPVPGLGHDAMGDAFIEGELTHDRSRYSRYKDQLAACPDLALGGPTWGWLDFALRAVAELTDPAALKRVAIPVVVVAAGQDRLVLNADSRRVADTLPRGRYIEIPGAFHEVLVETDDIRAQVWAAFDSLVAEVMPPG